MSRRRQAVLLLFSLGCFVLLCVWCSDWFRLTFSLLASFPCSGRPSVCSLVPSGPVSALLVPPSGYLVVFRRPGCHAGHGVLWRLGTLLHSLYGLYTMLRVLFRCSSFLHWGIHHWCDPDSPQDAARAACAPLLGPCCSSLLFLLPSQAPSLLLLLASACCLLPRPFRSLASFARFAAFVCFGLLFLPLCFGLFVVVGFVFVWCFWSGLSLLFVWFVLVWWAVLAASLLRWLRTTKDFRPQHHTHTLHSAFLPPVTFGGSSLSSLFGPFSVVLAALSPRPADLFRTV